MRKELDGSCNNCRGVTKIIRLIDSYKNFDIIQHDVECTKCSFHAQTTIRRWHKSGKEETLWDRWSDGKEVHLGGILRKKRSSGETTT